MAVEIKTLSNLDEEKWNRLLEESPHSTVYHTKSWAQIWQRSYPESNSFFIITVDEKGDYLAGLPIWQRKRFGLKSIYSMPFGTYGGLIKKKGADGSVSLLLYEELLKMLEEWRAIKAELVDFSLTDHHLQEIGFSVRRYYAHLILLDQIDENDYVSTLTRERKKCIRQSRRRGVEVRDVHSLDEVRRCYELSLGTRRRHDVKSTKYPLELLENIYNLMNKRNLLRWFVALRGERVIGSLVNFVFKDTFYAWEGGSDFQELNARPNDALYVYSILWAKRNGLRIFNFGATPEKAEGMIRFKESWGAHRKEYLIYEKKKGLGEFIERIKGIRK
jgi:lipid II:glycine glycyltransferase (peptidoglycan interpeptide bridge formation enzyme)